MMDLLRSAWVPSSILWFFHHSCELSTYNRLDYRAACVDLHGRYRFCIHNIFSIFPRRLFHRTWIWAVIWLPAVILIPQFIFTDHLPIYSFPHWQPRWLGPLTAVIYLIAFCAMGTVPVLNYRRIRDLNDRRRFRAVLIGILAFIIGLLPLIAVEYSGCLPRD